MGLGVRHNGSHYHGSYPQGSGGKVVGHFSTPYCPFTAREDHLPAIRRPWVDIRLVVVSAPVCCQSKHRQAQQVSITPRGRPTCQACVTVALDKQKRSHKWFVLVFRVLQAAPFSPEFHDEVQNDVGHAAPEPNHNPRW